MGYQHVGCGGAIDTRGRKCLRCKRTWGLFSFWFNTSSIRPVLVTKGPDKGKVVTKASYPIPKYSYTNWRDNPWVLSFTSILPNWPRKTRLTISALLLLIVLVGWLWSKM